MKTYDTRKSLRRNLVVGYASLFLALGVFGSWAALANINGAVIAGATVVVESSSKKIQHKEGGIVSRILAKDGDRVTAGQDLVILDPTDVKAELAITQGLLEELLVKRARLEAQRDGTPTVELPEEIKARQSEPAIAQIISGQLKLLKSSTESADTKALQLREQIGQLKEQIEGVEAQLSANKSQSALIEKELGGLRKLQQKGLVPNSRILGVEREAAALEGQRGELAASKASAKSRIGEIELQIISLREDLRTEALQELRDTEARIAELKERRLALTSTVARSTIKAPITGTIYQTAIHTVGGVVGAGETLMLIVPEGDDLVLQAMVSPNDIDQVTAGQEAEIKFPAFNAATTPKIMGRVQQVGADTIQMNAESPPFYSVRLIIPATELSKLGESKLKPGMVAEAYIQTSARSPFSYLVRPLVDQFSRAMREP